MIWGKIDPFRPHNPIRRMETILKIGLILYLKQHCLGSHAIHQNCLFLTNTVFMYDNDVKSFFVRWVVFIQLLICILLFDILRFDVYYISVNYMTAVFLRVSLQFHLRPSQDQSTSCPRSSWMVLICSYTWTWRRWWAADQHKQTGRLSRPGGPLPFLPSYWNIRESSSSSIRRLEYPCLVVSC